MKIRFSKDFAKLLDKIRNKDKKLTDKINKQLKLFVKEPRHPSLKTHKLTGKLKNRWSISVSRSLRMIYVLLKSDEAYFIALGTHDEVYKK